MATQMSSLFYCSVCIVNICFVLIDRKIISGKVICMNELDLLNTKESAKVEQNWISKKELAEICGVDDKTIQRITNDILSLDIDVQAQNHIKKGGYHNSEVFYDDYLVKLIQAKLIQAKLKKNGLSHENQMEKTWQSKAKNITNFLVWKQIVSMFL